MMKKIGILYHPSNRSTLVLAEDLGELLANKNMEYWLCSAWDDEKAKRSLNGTDLILSVGGDGTILRAAQVALVSNIPVTGINTGNLGFMTEIKADEAKEKLDDILGNGWLDERTMLEVSIDEQSAYHVLNDVVLTRGDIIRTIITDVLIDGDLFTTYRGDGVILSTATGSTGYSFAAGGPVLYPSAKEFILNPILPHLINAYSLVLPADTSVTLIVRANIPVVLSLDGHTNLHLSEGGEVKIKRSSHTTRFLRRQSHNSFYSTLEQKLKGKQYK